MTKKTIMRRMRLIVPPLTMKELEWLYVRMYGVADRDTLHGGKGLATWVEAVKELYRQRDKMKRTA